MSAGSSQSLASWASTRLQQEQSSCASCRCSAPAVIAELHVPLLPYPLLLLLLQ